MIFYAFIAVFIIALFGSADAHNSYFTCESHDALDEGILLMGEPVVLGSRSVTVKRSSSLLASPSTFAAGESLQITLTAPSEQVLESSGGAMFQGGIYCPTSKRSRYIYGGSATLIMPTDEQAVVEVWGGYASQYGQFIELTWSVASSCVTPITDVKVSVLALPDNNHAWVGWHISLFSECVQRCG